MTPPPRLHTSLSGSGRRRLGESPWWETCYWLPATLSRGRSAKVLPQRLDLACHRPLAKDVATRSPQQPFTLCDAWPRPVLSNVAKGSPLPTVTARTSRTDRERWPRELGSGPPRERGPQLGVRSPKPHSLRARRHLNSKAARERPFSREGVPASRRAALWPLRAPSIS